MDASGYRPRGQNERHSRLPNIREGWARLETQLDPDCWAALEITGSAFELHDCISRWGGKTLLAHPVELKRLGSGRHTDCVDAARLAKMLALGTIPTVWVPPQPLREIRNLLYYHERLVSTGAPDPRRGGGCPQRPWAGHDQRQGLTPNTGGVFNWRSGEIWIGLDSTARLA